MGALGSMTPRTATLLAVALLAACGTSPTELCKSACRKQISCTGGTTQQITSCERACETSPTDYSACTNGGAILGCAQDCLSSKNCNDYAECVRGCPKCITDGASQGAPTTRADGGGGGGSGGGSDPPAMRSDYCTALCQKLDACQGTTSCDPTRFRQMTCDPAFGANPSPCVQGCVTSCSAPSAACPATEVLGCVQRCAAACGGA